MLTDDTYGLIARKTAIHTRYSDKDLTRLLAQEELDRVWRGQYLPRGPLTDTPNNPFAETLERYRRTIIAAARCGTVSRVVSHSSAAAMHHVPLLRPATDVVHFTAARNGRIRGHAVIHEAALRDDDVVEIAGIRVTSLARTVADTARMGDFEKAITVLDQGVRRGAGVDDIHAVCARQARHRGIGVLRRALPHVDPRAASVGESYSRAIILDMADIPAPDLQWN